MLTSLIKESQPKNFLIVFAILYKKKEKIRPYISSKPRKNYE